MDENTTLTVEISRAWDDATGRFWHTAQLVNPEDPFDMPYAESESCETAKQAVLDLLDRVNIEFDGPDGQD